MVKDSSSKYITNADICDDVPLQIYIDVMICAAYIWLDNSNGIKKYFKNGHDH